MRKQVIHNDVELMAGFRLGHEQSFTEVFDLLYHALCFYSLRITKDQGTAEDITEESFVKVWERRQNFQHYPVLKSFLYTTVRNASINWQKKSRQQEKRIKELHSFSESSEHTKLDNIVAAETLRELYAALSSLPPQCRKIITMLFIEGKKPGQVAEALELSVANVSTQKKRGLLLLRKAMPHLFL
jgi:RNA polymerase sigma-70 factor (ECF subfamily)